MASLVVNTEFNAKASSTEDCLSAWTTIYPDLQMFQRMLMYTKGVGSFMLARGGIH